jgi:hypothetical protein
MSTVFGTRNRRAIAIGPVRMSAAAIAAATLTRLKAVVSGAGR